MTFFERVIKYYDFDDESRTLIKIAGWLDDKTDEYEKPQIRYFFWNGVFLVYLCYVIIIPQAFTIAYYLIISKKYPLRVCKYDIDNFYDNEEDIEVWCKVNNIDMFSLYKFFDSDVIIYDNHIDESKQDDLAFRNEEDVMAFKLMWI